MLGTLDMFTAPPLGGEGIKKRFFFNLSENSEVIVFVLVFTFFNIEENDFIIIIKS